MNIDQRLREAAAAARSRSEGHRLPPLPGRDRRAARNVALVIGTACAVAVLLGLTSVFARDGGDVTEPGPSTTVPAAPSTLPQSATGPDGARWELVFLPVELEFYEGAVVRSAALHGDRLVLIGWVFRSDSTSRLQVWWSDDGRSWSAAPFGDAGDVAHDVASNGEMLVAVGQSHDDSPAIWTSADGEWWFPSAVPDVEEGVGATVTAVAAFRDGFVAVGSASLVETAELDWDSSRDFGVGVVWFSADGRTWTEVHAPVFGGGGWVAMRDVATNGTDLVVVGSQAPSKVVSVPKAWHSVDGLRWEDAPIDDRTENAEMMAVAVLGEVFYGVGADWGVGPDSAALAVWVGGPASWERFDTMDAFGARSIFSTVDGFLAVPATGQGLWYWREGQRRGSPMPADLLPESLAWLGGLAASTDNIVYGSANRLPALWYWTPPAPTLLPGGRFPRGGVR